MFFQGIEEKYMTKPELPVLIGQFLLFAEKTPHLLLMRPSIIGQVGNFLVFRVVLSAKFSLDEEDLIKHLIIFLIDYLITESQVACVYQPFSRERW